MKPTKEIYLQLNKATFRLSMQRRWTKVLTKDNYDELSKQALNCMIAFFLAVEVEHSGIKVKWENFPKIALHRVFMKAYVLQDVSQNTITKICRFSEIDEDKVFEKAKEYIAKQTDEEFCNEIFEAVKSEEAEIYQAATKIGTYIEFRENQSEFKGISYEQLFQDVTQQLTGFKKMPGFARLSDPRNAVFQIFEVFSGLRNQNRWVAYGRGTDCSVLGHSLDVGLLSYFMCLEEFPGNEEMATFRFFVGLFHDAAEALGNDISSKIKELLGIRAAVDRYELFLMEDQIYCILFDYTKAKFKSVMMEDDANQEIHKDIKGADYLDASMECWRNLVTGSRDFNFWRAIVEFRDTMKEGRARLTPIAMEFYEWLEEEANKVKGTLMFY